MKKITSGIALSALAVLLNGCGGGGGGDVSDGGSATSNTTSAAAASSNTTAAVATSSDPIDKYLGTIVGGCNANTWITDSATGAILYARVTLTSQAKTSATKALFQIKHDIFETSGCGGTPRTTLTVSGANTWFNVDGATTVGGKVVDKITNSEDAKLPGISAGATITVNGVRYNAKYVAQFANKDLAAFVGKDLYLGDFSKALDAEGYPTELQQQPTATMQ